MHLFRLILKNSRTAALPNTTCRRWTAGLPALVLVLSIAACGGGASSGEDAPTASTATVGVGSQPTSNPSTVLTPTGSPPTGSPPTGSPPTGSTPTGSTPTGSTPTGSTPTGSTSSTATIATIALPIEVLGPSGTSKSVSFNLQSAQGVTEIYLRCYACGYDDRTLDADPAKVKATLRINGGPPIALKSYTGGDAAVGNSAVKVMSPEKEYGGIGGGFRTVRLTVPATGLKAGTNTLTFEHTTPDARSIGFRIIDLTVLQGAVDAIPKAQRQLVDPSLWKPALPAADIAIGKALWSKRDSLYDAHVDSLDGTMKGGNITGNIKASCAECHASSGRDLKYFNFSDESITQRSKFHGLSDLQGKQIASYIRSLANVTAPAGAWPWNPPYQPGPGMDAKPVTAWAAGAGVDAVLAKDADMLPYLFPGSRTDAAAVTKVVDRYSTLNMRELPIALQLPDWNTWLPRLHPIDAFNSNVAEVRTDEKGQQVYAKPFFEVMYDTAAAAPSSAALDTMFNRTTDWFRRGATCFTQSIAQGPDLRSIDGIVSTKGLALAGAPSFAGRQCTDYRIDEPQMWAVEAAKTGLSAWLAVKQWELVQSNSLEEDSKRIGTNVCSGGRCINASEARGWGTTNQNIFQRAAHYTGFNSRRFRDQDKKVSTYGNTAWYHLQLVLNGGYRQSQPAHFPYVQLWIEDLQIASDLSQSYRYWATQIKMRQLQTNGNYGIENGLDLRTAQPFFLYSDFGRTRSVVRRGVGPELWKNLVDAQLRDFLADAANATPADWAAASGNSEVQAPTSTVFAPCDAKCFTTPGADNNPFKPDAMQGQNTFRVIGKMRTEVGVDPVVLNSLINWGAMMWPLGDWDSVR